MYTELQTSRDGVFFAPERGATLRRTRAPTDWGTLRKRRSTMPKHHRALARLQRACLAAALVALALPLEAAAQTITEFPIPLVGGGPDTSLDSITAGADGALWFTVFEDLPDLPSTIGRITTDGAVS